MDATFRKMFEAMKQTAEALIDANQAMVRANEGIVRVSQAAMAANEEHEELRDTVQRLEALVMELVRKASGNGQK